MSGIKCKSGVYKKTIEHRLKLRTSSKLFYKDKNSKEYKEWKIKQLIGMNRPEVLKKCASFGFKGKHHSEETKEKMRNASITHHIDLNKKNNKKSNKIELKNEASHQRIHRYAYQYILNKFGLKEIKKYINWTIQNGLVHKIPKEGGR